MMALRDLWLLAGLELQDDLLGAVLLDTQADGQWADSPPRIDEPVVPVLELDFVEFGVLQRLLDLLVGIDLVKTDLSA